MNPVCQLENPPGCDSVEPAFEFLLFQFPPLLLFLLLLLLTTRLPCRRFSSSTPALRLRCRVSKAASRLTLSKGVEQNSALVRVSAYSWNPEGGLAFASALRQPVLRGTLRLQMLFRHTETLLGPGGSGPPYARRTLWEGMPAP